MNCEYCHSKIFEDDRTCPQCGAPNESFIPVKQKAICFGELCRQIENYDSSILEDHLVYWNS
jgi:hypothetical protein